ncbi:MAG: radical SAM protein [Candidatus Diapherotrites archaeon]|nr:radical SAM protein [Candidatus Diapherotrites archaeon]
MNTVYGPVPSWRLGASLGIDPVCMNACTFDCVYCQLGPTAVKTMERKKFVEAADVEAQLREALGKTTPDTVTFSGMGEPTLALNLGEIAGAVKKITNIRMAILTNSSLLHLAEVRGGLKEFDIVMAKLDAPGQGLFEKINRPVPGITFEKVLGGIKALRREFSGRLALQIMFIEQNKHCAGELASLARELEPDEVFVDTPLRPCACPPLPGEEMEKIKKEFAGLKVSMVYDAEKPRATPLDLHETRARRPVQ